MTARNVKEHGFCNHETHAAAAFLAHDEYFGTMTRDLAFACYRNANEDAGMSVSRRKVATWNLADVLRETFSGVLESRQASAGQSSMERFTAHLALSGLDQIYFPEIAEAIMDEYGVGLHDGDAASEVSASVTEAETVPAEAPAPTFGWDREGSIEFVTLGGQRIVALAHRARGYYHIFVMCDPSGQWSRLALATTNRRKARSEGLRVARTVTQMRAEQGCSL